MRAVRRAPKTDEPMITSAAEWHRVEAARLTLSVWPVARLAEDENPNAPAVKREAEEDWGGQRWR